MQAVLVTIARTIAGRGSAVEVARVVADEVRCLLPADQCSIWRWLPERDGVELLAAAQDADLPMPPVGTILPLADSAYRPVLEACRTLRQADLSDAPAEIERTLTGAGLRARLVVPVLIGGKPIGLLVVTARQPGAYTAAHARLLEQLAVQLAVGLEQARLHDEIDRCQEKILLEGEQRRRHQLEAIRAVTAELTRELDLRTLLDLILRRASELVNCPAAALLLWDEQTHQLAPNAWLGYGGWAASMRYRLGQAVVGLVAERREGMVVNDYRSWPAADPAVLANSETMAVMGVPIVYQERLIGVLTSNRYGACEPFTRQDLELLELFGSQAAIAIENARLFEEATAAEALRELARLKAEFLNTASHELRTPLSLIHGYAELLIHRAGSMTAAEVARMSAEIYAGSRTLTRLMDDLLDFSRLDRGCLALRLEPVLLDAFLDQVVLELRGKPSGSRVCAECPPGLEVEVDPDRLHQIVTNLLSNALTYAIEGPILVRAARQDELVRIEVSDSGPGLLPAEIDRVWETFYRGVEAAHLPNRGSGLGLAVVKQLVGLHGGQVGVQSVPGQGATFWFSLPLRHEAATLLTDAEAPLVLRPEDRRQPGPAGVDASILSA